MDAFIACFQASLASGWSHVSVVESLRFLGYHVGRGDIEMDCHVSHKITARAQAIPDLNLGTAASVLGNVVAFSQWWSTNSFLGALLGWEMRSFWLKS
eukprot:6456505-Amphidinium_carterae.1